MVEKNKEYVVQVISQGYEGEGIAKINESYPIFIEGALSGEVVRVKIIKVNKNLTVFTSLPDKLQEDIDQEKVLETLVKNYSFSSPL